MRLLKWLRTVMRADKTQPQPAQAESVRLRRYVNPEVRVLSQTGPNTYLTQLFDDGVPVGRPVLVLSTPSAFAYFNDPPK